MVFVLFGGGETIVPTRVTTGCIKLRYTLMHDMQVFLMLIVVKRRRHSILVSLFTNQRRLFNIIIVFFSVALMSFWSTERYWLNDTVFGCTLLHDLRVSFTVKCRLGLWGLCALICRVKYQVPVFRHYLRMEMLEVNIRASCEFCTHRRRDSTRQLSRVGGV